jgi:hypothetical protein
MPDPEISGEMIALWRRCRGMQDRGEDREWEDAGGRRAEYLEARSRLGAMLGIQPWMVTPLHARSPIAPKLWRQASCQYAQAHRLWLLFEQAARCRARSRPPAPPPGLTDRAAKPQRRAPDDAA